MHENLDVTSHACVADIHVPKQYQYRENVCACDSGEF
jgi:hypothetical protein